MGKLTPVFQATPYVCKGLWCKILLMNKETGLQIHLSSISIDFKERLRELQDEDVTETSGKLAAKQADQSSSPS